LCYSRGIPWVGSGGKWGMQDYYIKMMDQGYKINPDAVYFVEVGVHWSCIVNGANGHPSVQHQTSALSAEMLLRLSLAAP
jgi:hypothetical protein